MIDSHRPATAMILYDVYAPGHVRLDIVIMPPQYLDENSVLN